MSPIASFTARTLAASSLFSSSAPPSGIVLSNSVENGTLVASWADSTGPAVSIEGAAGGFVPVTVVRTTKVEKATCEWVKSEIERFKAEDEVFDDSFLENIYLDGPTSYEDGLAGCLGDTYSTSNIASGPYVLYVSGTSGSLGKVYRIHPDHYQAFMSSSLPGPNGSFVPAPFNTESESTVGIAVPSRIYTLDADLEKKPLAGKRVGVKDIIDMKGLKTSNGNRAWFDLYEPANTTAPSIQTLVDLGADIVGKTKTVFDYHDAFNARGDGYQDPGASSAGSGAAIGAYEWLDVAVGTDTGGSIRIPASYNGIYGLRPSFGSLSVEGVLPEGPYFDAVGYHTRSPYLLESFGKHWMGSTHQSYPSLPKVVHVPDDLFPVTSDPAQTIYTEFVDKLCTFLNATVDMRNISVYWGANVTAETPERSEDIFQYLHTVGFDLEWKYQYDTVFAPFEEKYAEENEGRLPFLNPTVAARIGYYKNATADRFEEARKRQLEFKTFFEDEVGLWLTPSNAGRVGYINTYPIVAPSVNETALTFSQLYYSVFSGAPEVVVPIGQVPYNSTLSGIVEYSPVTVDILARPGCDYVLLDLVAQLADAGLLQEVKTGRTAF
ncbi:hypothetical protein JCM8547_006530 [Rhodosporidiobolus lusitaniae]